MNPEELRAVAEQYGRYFHRLGAQLDSGDATFMLSLTPELFNEEVDDGKHSPRCPSVTVLLFMSALW